MVRGVRVRVRVLRRRGRLATRRLPALAAAVALGGRRAASLGTRRSRRRSSSSRSRSAATTAGAAVGRGGQQRCATARRRRRPTPSLPLAQLAVPMVLDRVVRTTGKPFTDGSPAVTKLRLRRDDLRGGAGGA
jgi:hypothetical protein